MFVAQITVDRQRAIAMCESIGFRGEAPRRDDIKRADERKHDIVLLGHDVTRHMSLKKMYGPADAF